MTSQEDNIKEKDFLIKAYTSLTEIKKVIQKIAQNHMLSFQLSILGKRPFDDLNQISKLEEINTLLNETIVGPTPFGYFKNPDIGDCFITGHLTGTFLHKVDQKKLASLPAGLLGIFRGIGIELECIDQYIQELKKGGFLLIIRGEAKDLEALKIV